MELLPTIAERADIVRQTARLVERAGLEPFVAAPLVESNDRYFPDAWTPDLEGVRALGARVLGYARLTDLVLEVERAELSPDPAPVGGVAIVEVAIATARVTVDERGLVDPLAALATLARVAAIAFRLRHSIEEDTDELERRYTDLTTVYLGFGLITTNAAYRYRASGGLQGSIAVTSWSHTTLGELSFQAMAYALAVQARVRCEDERAIEKRLETNQAKSFRAALDAVGNAPLALPDRASWPERRPLPPEPKTSAWKQLLPPTTAGPQIPTAIATGIAGGPNAGRKVFRGRADRKGNGAWFGAIGALATLTTLAILGHGPWIMASLLLIPLGGFAGKQITRELCMGAGCERRLAPDATRCPSCGGTIVGQLLPGENRLEAEERLGIDDDEA